MAIQQLRTTSEKFRDLLIEGFKFVHSETADECVYCGRLARNFASNTKKADPDSNENTKSSDDEEKSVGANRSRPDSPKRAGGRSAFAPVTDSMRKN